MKITRTGDTYTVEGLTQADLRTLCSLALDSATKRLEKATKEANEQVGWLKEASVRWLRVIEQEYARAHELYEMVKTSIRKQEKPS
jgi:hypothetical protein